MNKEEYAIFPGQIKINNCTYFGLDYELTDFVNHLAEQNQKYKEVIYKANKLIDKCIFPDYDEQSNDFQESLYKIKEILKEAE